MQFLEGNFGIEFIKILQTGIVGKSLWYLLLPFHYLGSESGYLIVLPVIYWSVNKRLGKELFILALFSTIITNVLKNWWARPRPFHVSPSEIHPIEFTTEFGLPSGHTIFGTLLGLSFLKNSKKNWQVVISLLLIFFMGISRMVHGMHFLQDVVLGWILGFLFFFVFQKINNRLAEFLKNQNFSLQVLTVFILAILAFFAFDIFGNEFAAKKAFISPLGGLLGGITGILLDNRFIQFSDVKTTNTRIIRTALGLITTVLLFLILDYLYYSLVGETKNTMVLFLYLIRYSIVACWITAGVPYLFKQFNLN